MGCSEHGSREDRAARAGTKEATLSGILHMVFGWSLDYIGIEQGFMRPGGATTGLTTE